MLNLIIQKSLISKFFNYGVGDMAQSLVDKDPSSAPWHPHKNLGVMMHVCNTSTWGQGQVDEVGESLDGQLLQL